MTTLSRIRPGAAPTLILALLLTAACGEDPPVGPEPVTLQDEIALPDGFRIDYFARGITRPRSLALGDDGTVFVGSYFFTAGVQSPVYALRDTDGDGDADERTEIWKGFNTPNGVDFHDGALYVVDEDRVFRLDDAETLLDRATPQVIYDDLPSRAETAEATHLGHWWRPLRVGPDGRLYISVGTRWSLEVGRHSANDIADQPRYSSIVRMNRDGTGFEVFAGGVRNSMGMDFHPGTGDLWFTDNGSSWPFSDPRFYDIPPDELNHAPTSGEHFGFPWIHGREPDPFSGGDTPPDTRAPAYEFLAHSAPLGMRFYTGSQFPERYRGQIFVAEHGTEATTPAPLNKLHGDRISLIRLDAAGAVVGYEVFADGFRRGSNANYTRRPVDLLVLPDGSLLVSDDQAHAIYRIWYEG